MQRLYFRYTFVFRINVRCLVGFLESIAGKSVFHHFEKRGFQFLL